MNKLSIILTGVGIGFAAFGVKLAAGRGVGVIGGADGPTAIFIGAKYSLGLTAGFVAAGMLLIAAAIALYCKSKK